MIIDFKALRDDLQRLRGEDGVVTPKQAEEMLAKVLRPLLSFEGFELFVQGGLSDGGADMVGRRLAEGEQGRVSVLIQYKHFGQGRKVNVTTVRELIGAATDTACERAMLVGRFGFTSSARELAGRIEPTFIQLLDLADIEAWIKRIETGPPGNAARVQLLIRSVSHEFAKLVAADPEVLDHLEWRDLERMMARVMEGLGFVVTLTPPSKDGGKDLILACTVTDGKQSFVVELKHWRSGKRVGKQAASDFMKVIVAEKRSGGLFLSTSGYTPDIFEELTEITRQRLRFGERTKVVMLAQTYVRACSGLWFPPAELPQVLFEATL